MAKVLHGKRPLDGAIIRSNCQGATQYNDKARLKRARRIDLYILETTIRKAHPERCRPEEDFEQNDWGIYLADTLVGGNLHGF